MVTVIEFVLVSEFGLDIEWVDIAPPGQLLIGVIQKVHCLWSQSGKFRLIMRMPGLFLHLSCLHLYFKSKCVE
jgi:hypothetical protein